MIFFIIEENKFITNFAMAEQTNPLKFGVPDFCDECKATLTLRKWLPPYNVILDSGNCGDFIYGSFPEFIASERFKNDYQKSDLKGILNFHNVKITKIKGRKKKVSLSNFYKADIMRSGATIDEEKSNFIRAFDAGQQYCDKCKTGGIIKSFKGIHIVESTWTGEDIFFTKNLPGSIVVTEKFVNFIEQGKYSNMEFIEANKYHPLWAGGGFSKREKDFLIPK